GRMLVFPLADLPELARGKGNKIIGIPPARFKSGDECMTAAIAAPESTAILVQCGQRTMTLKPRDLEKYAGSRGRRGTLLPRGWRKVDALAVQADT
ncbi:MAG: DNA gyrase C-terminal beta-propeller domain-containing protein, partial [Gammaproteobacteria bacterium]